MSALIGFFWGQNRLIKAKLVADPLKRCFLVL